MGRRSIDGSIDGGGTPLAPPTYSEHLSHPTETLASLSAKSPCLAGLPLPSVPSTKGARRMPAPAVSTCSLTYPNAVRQGVDVLWPQRPHPSHLPALPGLQTLPSLSVTPHSICHHPGIRKVPPRAPSTHSPCCPQLSPSVHGQVSSKRCPRFPCLTSSLPTPSGTLSGLASTPIPSAPRTDGGRDAGAFVAKYHSSSPARPTLLPGQPHLPQSPCPSWPLPASPRTSLLAHPHAGNPPRPPSLGVIFLVADCLHSPHPIASPAVPGAPDEQVQNQVDVPTGVTHRSVHSAAQAPAALLLPRAPPFQ